jgi:hypothetical protein
MWLPMIKKRIVSSIIVCGLTTTLILTMLLTLGHSGSASFMHLQAGNTGDEDNGSTKMPVAVYSASLPNDPIERTLRVARSGRYDKRDPVPFDQASRSARGRAVFSDWYAYIPALPASQSDLIIRGDVVSAGGYLSNDRTGAYSEFSIQIDEMFKPDGRTLGASIVAVREGADVQLPSGRIFRYEIVHQGMPVIGRRYLLFLKYNPEGKDYTILTGYELRRNRVYPIDEVAPFIVYKRFDESPFLNLVRETIRQSTPKEG